MTDAILDAAKNIANATAQLVVVATKAQKEISSASGGASKKENVYKSDPAWAKGQVFLLLILLGECLSVRELRQSYWRCVDTSFFFAFFFCCCCCFFSFCFFCSVLLLGLISAAQAVAGNVKLLVNAANKAARG